MKKGLPDPFVDSLKHESIIVQIPLLHGHVSNRLEQILSIFDQTNVSKESKQTIQIEDSEYPENSDIQYVIKKLMMASASADLRRKMDVEEEFFSEIDSRDAELRKLKKEFWEKIDEQERKIDNQKQELEQKDLMIRSMAQSMLNAGMSLEEIAKVTNMSEERLYELLK